MKNSKERSIKDLALFQGCSAADVQWIARVADEIVIPAGRVLASEGAVSREFVVVMDGRAVGRDGGADVILPPGSFFGEAGILDGVPNAHTITTRSDAKLLVLTRQAFRGLLDRAPVVAGRLLRGVAGATQVAHQTELSLRAVS